MARHYFWIVVGGRKPSVLYGGESEQSAISKGREMLPDTEHQIMKLDTKDADKALKLATKKLSANPKKTPAKRDLDRFGWLA